MLHKSRQSAVLLLSNDLDSLISSLNFEYIIVIFFFMGLSIFLSLEFLFEIKFSTVSLEIFKALEEFASTLTFAHRLLFSSLLSHWILVH